MESSLCVHILKNMGSMLGCNNKKRIIYRVGQYEYGFNNISEVLTDAGLDDARTAWSRLKQHRADDNQQGMAWVNHEVVLNK